MIIDAHQHFWNMDRVSYPWLIPEYGPIYRNFEADDLEDELGNAGVDGTVLVQAANSYEDTAYMLEVAQQRRWVKAVVGWAPLDKPEEAERFLKEQQQSHHVFAGIRHLIHEEQDPDWVVRPKVLEGLSVLEALGMTFDVVAVFPNHLQHVNTLACLFPELRIVIDHLAKPPFGRSEFNTWAEQIRAAAKYDNVFAKLSGLNTAVNDPLNWDSTSIKPAIDVALDCFGCDRLMYGGDWPVSILAGNYEKVWVETNKAISGLSTAHKEQLLGLNAINFYNIQR